MAVAGCYICLYVRLCVHTSYFDLYNDIHTKTITDKEEMSGLNALPLMICPPDEPSPLTHSVFFF